MNDFPPLSLSPSANRLGIFPNMSKTQNAHIWGLKGVKKAVQNSNLRTMSTLNKDCFAEKNIFPSDHRNVNRTKKTSIGI